MKARSGGAFLAQAGRLGALTLISSGLGFVRELSIVHMFGAGPATDAYLIALSIPTLLYAFLVGSGLNVTVVPPLASLLTRDPKAGSRRFSEFFSVALLVGATGSLLIFCFASRLVSVIAPGLQSAPLARLYASELAPFFFLMVAAYSIGTFHCARQKTSFWGLIGVMQNAVLVMFVLTLSSLGPGILVGGTLFGACLAFLLQLWLLLRSGYREPLVSPSRAGSGYRTFCAMLPFAMALGIGGDYGTNQVEILLIRFFASRLDPGTITLLTLGNKLMAVPVLFIGAAIGLALLPAASVAFGDNDPESASSILVRALTIALLLASPVLILYWHCAPAIVHLLFGMRSLSPAQMEVLAAILRNYSGAVVGLTLTFVLGRMVSAMRKNRFLIAFGLATLACESLIMPWSARNLGGAGIARAISLGSFLYAGLLSVVVLRQIGREHSMLLIGRITMIAGGGVIMHILMRTIESVTFSKPGSALVQLAPPLLAGFSSYLLWIFGNRRRLGLESLAGARA